MTPIKPPKQEDYRALFEVALKNSLCYEIEMLTAFIAPQGFEKDLNAELGLAKVKNLKQFEQLFIGEISQQNFVWAEDLWPNCQIVPIASITDAAKKLKQIKKLWVPLSIQLHRRTSLIVENLPRFIAKQIPFNSEFKFQDFGVFTLLSEKEMLICEKPRSQYPLGQWQFVENKKSPSRAYLKLWETFTREQFFPDGVCLDLGSSPGGWTEVLAGLATKVISVDKAELAPQVAKLKNVNVLKKDAFKLQPKDIEPIDWLFSDIICTPDRLLELVQLWKPHVKKGLVCTIKFKGTTDFETLKKFAEFENSKTFHLHHNKHEVTWVYRS